MNTARYSILSDFPYPNRTEHVHLGIMVIRHDGEVRVHLADDLRKVRAINPRASLELIRSWEAELPLVLGDVTPQTASAALAQFSGHWRLSEQWGAFRWTTETDYLHRVASALSNLIAPRERLRPTREPVSKLNLDLRRSFDLHGWIGKDIDKHEIVARYPIGPEVTAEFALKNGRFHVIESLDLRVSTPSAKRQEAQAKALAFDMARRLDKGAAGYAVLAGLTSAIADGARALLAEYADNVYAWESPSDMNALFKTLGAATGKPLLPEPPIGALADVPTGLN